MPSTPLGCPCPRSRVVDLYFLEHRAKLLDLAAFLDRVDRAAADTEHDDFRIVAFRKAVAVLLDDEPGRARRIQEVLSDHSTEPIASAAGLKGAHGACPPSGADS